MQELAQIEELESMISYVLELTVEIAGLLVVEEVDGKLAKARMEIFFTIVLVMFRLESGLIIRLMH